MSKPNRTVAAFRQRVPFFTKDQQEANSRRMVERSRQEKPEFWTVMDAVSNGEMTPKEAEEKMKAMGF